MTIQSAAVNDKLKTDLHNNFTVGTNIYPGSPQASLHLLDKYSKQVAVQPVQPQGHSFAQGGRGSGQSGGQGRAEAEVMPRRIPTKTKDPAKVGRFDLLNRCGGKDHIARVCTAPLPGKAAASSQSDDKSTCLSRSSRSSTSSSSSKKSPN